MDFRSLGSSLMSTLQEAKCIEHFNRRHLKQTLGSELDLSSGSLVTRNICYKTSSNIIRQQNLQIHIDCVNLSDAAFKILHGKYRRCLGIRICWHFMNFESSTPIIQIRENLVRFRDMQKYAVTLNDVFLNYISKQKIQFELYAAYENKEKHIGRSVMDLRDFLQCAQKEISQQLEILSLNKFKLFRKCQHNNRRMGVLALRYCLKPLSLTELPRVLDKVELEELYHKLHQNISSELLHDSDSILRIQNMHSTSALQEAKAKSLGVSVSDYSFVCNILDKVLDADEFLPMSKEEIDKKNRLKKINYDKSLEEYAILSGTHPKDALIYANDNIKVRNYDQRFNYESAVIINVISLHLNEEKYPLRKHEVREFYVEYSFLSRTGRDMETLSLPLLESRIIEYNFKRTFLIDNDSHRHDCKMIAKMIKDKESIKFIIIEEPIEDISRFQICKEVGLVEVNLFQLIQSEDNVVTDLYPIMDIRAPNDHIGYLKVSFWGVQAMRTVALKVLTSYVVHK